MHHKPQRRHRHSTRDHMLAIIFVISIFTVLLTYWLASLFSNLQPIERIISGG